MYVHHIVALVSFFLTFYFMNYTLVFGVMVLFTEISSAYISMRWLFYTHSSGNSTYSKLNTFWAAITFFLGRLVFQNCILFAMGTPLYFEQWKSGTLTWFGGFILIEFGLAISASTLMNCFWMYLIVLTVSRMLKRSSDDQEEDEQFKMAG